MNTLPTIIQQDSIAAIIQTAPKAYQDNQLSHQRCLQAGQNLLEAIQTAGQMTDELDQQTATYLEKTRNTLKKMNENRSPVTKLFDEVRKAFTTIENEIDPSKAGTTPHKLQQLRNAYADKKRKEQEQRQAEALRRQQAEQARKQLAIDAEEALRELFRQRLYNTLSAIKQLDEALTLDNFDTTAEKIKTYPTTLTKDSAESLIENMTMPISLPFTLDVVKDIATQTINRYESSLQEQYTFEINELKTNLLELLPTKRINLERIAKASQEEAEQLKAQMEQRQKEEADRIEQQRLQREEEERQKAQMQKQTTQMDGLFDQQATIATYQPKVKVAKKINLLNPEGILPIISTWWSKEGCTMTTEELAKIFKRQITFCERLATKEGTIIADESVEYIDQVKAK